MDTDETRPAWTGGWRPMRPQDLPRVVALAEAAHPDHPERPAVFAERRALAPDFCAVLDLGGSIFGYVLAHPWTGAAPPALDTLVLRLPDRPDVVHCHDCVIAPEQRGRGRLAPALATLEARAAGVAPFVSLVAVSGKDAFWARRGWRADVLPPDALASYGDGAVFMVKPVVRVGGRIAAPG